MKFSIQITSVKEHTSGGQVKAYANSGKTVGVNSGTVQEQTRCRAPHAVVVQAGTLECVRRNLGLYHLNYVGFHTYWRH